MTYAELIKELSKQQVDQWWNSPEAIALSDSDSQWKYKIKKGVRSAPYKEAIKQLAEYYKLQLDDFTSNDHNRDKFCENFDFEIVELLVFDSTEEKKFIDYYQRRVTNKKLFQDFISFCSSTLMSIGVNPYHFRFAITSDNVVRGIMAMRVVLGYNEKNNRSGVSLYLTRENYVQIKSQLPEHTVYEFSGKNYPVNVTLYVNKWSDIPNSILTISVAEIAQYYEETKSSKMNQWNNEAKSTNSFLKKVVYENIKVDDWISNPNLNNTMRQLNIEGKRVYKISMGTLLKDPNFSHIDPIASFEENNIVVMHSETGRNQGENFIHKAKIGDYLYLTYGQTRLGNLYRITTDIMQTNKQVKVDLDDGWVCRGVETIQKPILHETHLLTDKSQWLPSGYSTFVEISDLTEANKKLFEPYYNIHLINGTESSNRKQIQLSGQLNQILFGAPGTGKTFNTINRALTICGEDLDGLERHEIKELFDAKIASGQVVFTTFHQSMTYEDFIEGIKPIEPNKEGDPVIYKVVDGIFRRMCINASFSIAEESSSLETENVLDFSLAYDEFVNELEDKLSKEEEVRLISKNGGHVLVNGISSQGNIQINHPGKQNIYTISKSRLSELSKAIPDLNEVGNIDLEFREVIGGTNSTGCWAVLNAIRTRNNNSSINSINRTITWEEKKDVVNTLKPDFYKGKSGIPYVLIIDEINRGNVSEIFGELITLIEPDKRLGGDESLTVKLPYSKENFGVPSNLYILGTMNTADRSVEALDTALRRRFSFEEMQPNPELIRQVGESKGILDGIDLVELLSVINRRVEKLIDKDHMIGHSYFIKAKSISDLKVIFQNNIIPLLEEYFFGDPGKIGLILGEDFFEKQEDLVEELFAEFDRYDPGSMLEKEIYHLKKTTEMSDDKFVEAIHRLLRK